MMKKGRTTRIVVNGVLLAAIVALGVTVYQAGTQPNVTEMEEITNQEHAVPEEESATEDRETQQESVPQEAEESQETTGSQVEAREYADTQDDTEDENTQETQQEQVQEQETQDTATQAESVLPQVQFSEDTLMQWPVEGTLLMDYSMDQTTYFATLDQYKMNPAIVVKAEVGTPVEAAANATIYSITEDPVTGITVTAEMGNGYQAVYGQLKDVTVYEGQTIEEGTVLGYINEPTKYYSQEGSNLYFAMKKDGEFVDPMVYLP